MTAPEILGDHGYSRLRDWVIERTGLAYYSDKDGDFAARLALRLAARDLGDCSSYLRVLEHSAAGQREMDALVSELTIGETYFFRQREHFDALRRTVLPDLLERSGAGRRLRIWSAGCATGAEAYSLALLLRLEMAGQLIGWDVSILGTDINRAFLARAREGRFDEWAFRGVSEDLKTRCFRREGKHWVLLPEYRGTVSFQYHNLVSDPLPLGYLPVFDLILCRNVMIYFSRETVRATAGRFYDSLVEGGWLLVGHAEPNAEVFKAFRTVSADGITLYQKLAAQPSGGVLPRAEVPPPPAEACATRPRPARAPAVVRPVPTVAEARQLADRGEWDAAAVLCRRLLEADRLSAAAHFLFALIREHSGAHEQAERFLRRTIYLDRGFILAHYHLGLLLQRKQAAREARRALENALDLLSRRPPEERIEAGDGITAADLAQAARLHLNLLESA